MVDFRKVEIAEISRSLLGVQLMMVEMRRGDYKRKLHEFYQETRE